MLTFLAIAAATLASEDLTCIAAGLLIQRGELDLATGIAACTVGIFVGDLGLWSLGRVFGLAALAWPWMARRVPDAKARAARDWLGRHAAGAIVASRFMPGTRLALYLVSGVLRIPARTFATWALIAAALWTPTIVLLTAALGDVFVAWIVPVVRAGWTVRLGVAVIVLAGVRIGRTLAIPSQRVRLAAWFARARRWEFLPMWLFYAPVAAWVAMLAVRYRGLSTVTAANPGIADGGTVGESKFDILQRLPAEWTIASVLVPPGDASVRVELLRALTSTRGWSLPLILKPDVGQRGAGVRLAATWHDVTSYLRRVAAPVVAQAYHPGPFEAGIFYYRFPGDARGRIFSMTDKHFPVIVGDGVSTLEELIWNHPRFRMQGWTFVERHRDELSRVLPAGEPFALAIAGNHAQGTMFRDGSHLLTPELEARIDEIAHAYPGFFVGRFDVRYRDVEAFTAGRDLAIVELNGATGESTNIYDPDRTLWDAYRILFRQWRIVFAIGAANRRNGAPVATARRLVDLVRQHLAAETPFPVSD